MTSRELFARQGVLRTIVKDTDIFQVQRFYNASTWSDWYVNEDGNHECQYTVVEEFLVPVGYDGCVVSITNSRVEWPDGAYITDLDPNDFLLFRLN